MEQALNEFVGRHLAFNSSRLFKLMEVISFLNADLVRRTLPKLREQVAVTELKRGIGADSVLRYVYLHDDVPKKNPTSLIIFSPLFVLVINEWRSIFLTDNFLEHWNYLWVSHDPID